MPAGTMQHLRCGHVGQTHAGGYLTERSPLDRGLPQRLAFALVQLRQHRLQQLPVADTSLGMRHAVGLGSHAALLAIATHPAFGAGV